MTPGEIDDYVRAQLAAGARPLHAARRRAGRPGPRADPDPGPVPGLRPPVRPGRRRAGLPGLPGRRRSRWTRTRSTRFSAPSSTVGGGPGSGRGRGALSAALRARLDAVRRAVADRPGHGSRCRVGGPAVHRRALGARPGPGGGRRAGRRRTRAASVETTWDEIAAAAPDVVIVAPCGFHLDGAAEQARAGAPRLRRSAGVGHRRATASWCGPVRAWSTASRPSRRSCTRAPWCRRPPRSARSFPDRSAFANRSARALNDGHAQQRTQRRGRRRPGSGR